MTDVYIWPDKYKHPCPFLLSLSGLTEISFENQLLSLELSSINNSQHFEMYLVWKMLTKSFCVATPSQFLKVQALRFFPGREIGGCVILINIIP